jgi:subtilisin family serine protease
MFRSRGRNCATATVLGLMVATTVAMAADIKDPNEIIRGLAPIEYLPEHSGGAPGPSVDLTIPFALNSAKLKPVAQAQLQALGQALGSEKLRDKAIEIAGHTDATGKADYNRHLSERRAATVANFLIETFGFKARRFRVVGYGEDELKNPLTPEAAENRRVEISVIPSGNAGVTTATTLSTSSIASDDNMWTTSGGDLRRDPDAASALRAKAKRDNSVRVIIGLEASNTPVPEETGWQNLNDYVRGLQDRALDSLGWVNFNDLVRFDYTPAMAMTVDGNKLEELLFSSAVTQVYEDALYEPSLNRSVKIIESSSGQVAKQFGKGVAVAVLDTGIDRDHPFLRGKVVGEACFGTNGKGRQSVFRALCPTGQAKETGPGSAKPCRSTLGCSHGTHVAGIIAGSGEQFTGVSAAAKIVAVQVFNAVEGPACGRAKKCIVSLASDVIRGLEWVYRNRERYGIGVVNLSIGGKRFKQICDQSPLRRIFSLIRRAEIVSVAASGNNGSDDAVSSPACLTDVVSVGATTYADTVAEFSNSGKYLDFLAPGATRQPIGRRKGILSSVPGGRFRRMEGTSMAAPHIAGTFAALKSAVPTATVAEMIEAIRQTGKPIRDERNGLSRPRIRVGAAIKGLQKLVASRPPKPVPKPKQKIKHKPKPKPKPKPTLAKPSQPENVDGIRIYNDEEPVGGDGKIKW